MSLVYKRLTLSFKSYFCCLMYAWIRYQYPYSNDPRHSKKALTTASPQTTQVTEACDDDSYNTNTRLSHKLFLVPDDYQQPLQISSLCVCACVCVWSCGYALSVLSVCVWPVLMFLGPTCIACLVVLARKSNAATKLQLNYVHFYCPIPTSTLVDGCVCSWCVWVWVIPVCVCVCVSVVSVWVWVNAVCLCVCVVTCGSGLSLSVYVVSCGSGLSLCACVWLFCLSGLSLYVYVSVGMLPSVLWCCRLGGRKGIRPVKNLVVGCWHGYLSGARCRFEHGLADATVTHCLLLQ